MPSNKPESRIIKAAGAVAWRPGPDGEPRILLVHRKKYDDWSLPKGKAEPGELLPVTAAREVHEEGGARLALGRRLSSVRYNVGGRPKRVHYWAARVTSLDPRAVPNGEVDEVDWLTAADATQRVSYPRDHNVLADFARAVPDTVPLILLRHAKAQAKSGWKDDDLGRPLDDSGRGDAKALAEALACFAPGARILSSPAARCLDTVRPFAELAGLPVQDDPSLYIHSKGTATGDSDAPAALIASAIAAAVAAGQPAVVCAHRENLPDLQAAALAVLGLAPDGDAGPGFLAGSTLAGNTLAGSSLAGTSGDGPSGDGSPGAGASGDGAARPGAAGGLPRDWPDPLPTAGFWVLNIAPAAAAVPGPADAADPRDPASRAGWRSLLGPVRAALQARRAPAAGPAPAVPAPPPGVLVSADRYDLSQA